MREINLNSEVNEKCPIVFVLQHEKCECKACQRSGEKVETQDKK